MCEQAVIFGFPYLDTLKISLRPEWSHGVHFLGRGDADDMAKLEKILKDEQIMAVFTGEEEGVALITLECISKADVAFCV